MSNLEKIIVGAWIAVLLLIIAAVSIPVQYANKQNQPNQCCSANECAIQHHHEKAATESITNRQLQLFYDNLNEDYYLGQLSKHVEVKWGDLTANNWMGYTEQRIGGYIMIIDRATNPTSSGAYMTVAHEACHIKTWGQEVENHGPRFQNCMVNLALHGAFEGLW